MDHHHHHRSTLNPKNSASTMNRAIVSRSYGPTSSSSNQGSFGSRPQPRYFSLPPTSIAPPLLPLPISKPTMIPPAVQRRPRPASNSRKEQRSRREDAPQRAMEKQGDDDEDAVVLDASIYSISPPPSSLPLPRFSIAKTKPVPVASCVVEAIGVGASGGGGVDDGASDDLRRLLRL